MYVTLGDVLAGSFYSSMTRLAFELSDASSYVTFDSPFHFAPAHKLRDWQRRYAAAAHGGGGAAT